MDKVLDAKVLFTPLKLSQDSIYNHSCLNGLTLSNFEERVGEIEAVIAGILQQSNQNRALVISRRQDLAQVLLQVPINKLANGRLSAAAEKIIDSVAPRGHHVYESDLWSVVWSKIRPQNYTEVSPRDLKAVRLRIAEIARKKEQEALVDGRAQKARQVLLSLLLQNPGDPDLNETLVSGDLKRIIALAEDLSRQEALERTYPKGTPVHMKFCEGCDNWTAGESRCDCGDKRIGIESYGSFLDGTGQFYIIPC